MQRQQPSNARCELAETSAACLFNSPCRAGPGSPVFQFGSIYRMDTDGSGVELVATGG